MSSLTETAKTELSLEKFVGRYTEGDCWVLALELASRSDWQVAITSGEDHAFVVKPDEQLALDINGVQDLRFLLRDWGKQEARVFDSLAEAKEYFASRDWGSYSERIQWKLAGRIAELLLKIIEEQAEDDLEDERRERAFERFAPVFAAA